MMNVSKHVYSVAYFWAQRRKFGIDPVMKMMSFGIVYICVSVLGFYLVNVT